MSNIWKQQGAYSASQAATYDEGLRKYMLSVYNYMGSGLALTGILALYVANTPAILEMFYNINAAGQLMGMKPLGWVVALAPLGFVFFLGFKIQTMSFKAAQATFWAFAALMGVSMANIFLIYTGTSVARVFFITAGVFGAMSLYGYTTKRDLTAMGSFLFMGLIGIVIASVVNMFLQSSMMHFIISIIGVGVFVGLTAYDTQRIKGNYYAVADNAELAGKAAIMGALSLYLDFINLFMMLLQFFGDRR